MTMNADDFSLDELASAYLDDEVTPDERALAESDPVVMARVAEFRSLNDQFGADLTADFPAVAATQDDMIARALGLFDTRADAEVSADPPANPPLAPVVPLATPRRRRTIPWTSMAVAAAALGGLVFVGRAISTSGSDSATESAGGADPAAATIAAAAPDLASASQERISDAAATTAAATVTEAAAPAMTEAPAAQAASVATIGSINDGATAGEPQSTEAAAAPEPAAEFADTTVVSLAVEEQLQAYVASLVGAAADRKLTADLTSCLVNGVAVENVTWQGVSGVLVLSPDASAPTVAEIIDSTCGVLVSVAITR